MTLLVINLMLTALNQPVVEAREAPRAVPGAAAVGGAAR